MSLSTSDYDYEYPEELVALERVPRSRILSVSSDGPNEITWQSFYELFQPGDLLVVNNTKVIRARVYAESGLEILFIQSTDQGRSWEVLCPARKWPKGQALALPDGRSARLISTGLPQKIEIDGPVLTAEYFAHFGELPLPPYIQKARNERHMRSQDLSQYQTLFARDDREGSLAAPTASLHFTDEDRAALKAKGVQFGELTLHVGLGTFLPVHADQLDEHKMHKEYFEIPSQLVEQVRTTKSQGGRVWAMGTTVVRALETWASQDRHLLHPMQGESEIFIYPGYNFKLVEGLLTNFHQPRTTLMALVAAFRSREELLNAYRYAIEKKFRLFSYGDLTVWPPLPNKI